MIKNFDLDHDKRESFNLSLILIKFIYKDLYYTLYKGEIIMGYLFAVIIGMSLGLLGGGGSILPVPVLVYGMEMDAKVSIALSLAIVAITSLIGVFSHFKAKNVDIKIALIFGPIAMAGTFLGAKLSVFLSGQVQLIIFSVIMLVASIFMIKGRKETDGEKKELNYLFIILEGLVVGIITGIVGVGGGFLIVPALVLLTGLPMKRAIGTSLVIISAKSFSGFAGYVGVVEIPWTFLLTFSAVSGVGILIGSYLVKFVSQEKLKKAFAIFLIFMGIFILYKNKNVFLEDKVTLMNHGPVYTFQAPSHAA